MAVLLDLPCLEVELDRKKNSKVVAVREINEAGPGVQSDPGREWLSGVVAFPQRGHYALDLV